MLRQSGLTGTIPPELGKLAVVEELDLAYNNLTGPIPPSLGQLMMLKKLHLSGNQWSGCVPIGLWRTNMWVSDTDLARCEP